MNAEQFKSKIEEINVLLNNQPFTAAQLHKELTNEYARLSVADAEECLLPFMRATNDLMGACVMNLRDLKFAPPMCPEAEQLRALLVGAPERGWLRLPRDLGRLRLCVEMVRTEGLRDRVDVLANDAAAPAKWRELARRWDRVEEVVDALNHVEAEQVCVDAYFAAL